MPTSLSQPNEDIPSYLLKKDAILSGTLKHLTINNISFYNFFFQNQNISETSQIRFMYSTSLLQKHVEKKGCQILKLPPLILRGNRFTCHFVFWSIGLELSAIELKLNWIPTETKRICRYVWMTYDSGSGMRLNFSVNEGDIWGTYILVVLGR